MLNKTNNANSNMKEIVHIKKCIAFSYTSAVGKKKRYAELGVDCNVFEKPIIGSSRITRRGMLVIDNLTKWRVPVPLIYSVLIESKSCSKILEESKALDELRFIETEVVEERDSLGNYILSVVVKDRKSSKWNRPGTISSVIRMDQYKQTDGISIKLFDAIRLFEYIGTYTGSSIIIEKEEDILQ